MNIKEQRIKNAKDRLAQLLECNDLDEQAGRLSSNGPISYPMVKLYLSYIKGYKMSQLTWKYEEYPGMTCTTINTENPYITTNLCLAPYNL